MIRATVSIEITAARTLTRAQRTRNRCFVVCSFGLVAGRFTQRSIAFSGTSWTTGGGCTSTRKLAFGVSAPAAHGSCRNEATAAAAASKNDEADGDGMPDAVVVCHMRRSTAALASIYASIFAFVSPSCTVLGWSRRLARRLFMLTRHTAELFIYQHAHIPASDAVAVHL